MAGQVVQQLDHQVKLREPYDQVLFIGFVLLYISVQALDSVSTKRSSKSD